MSEEELHDEAAAQDTMAVAGKPASQVEAENPPEEVLEQEAREMSSRMPQAAEDEAAAADETEADAEPPAEPADQAPLEGSPEEG